MVRVQRPADIITGTRLALALVVAFVGPTELGLTLVAIALAMDWVDGQVARRTGTANPFGARFDMETDAFLIAVLSVYAAAAYGWWVLLIGAARYLLWLAERVAPWLRQPVPPRYWRKVVAAVQGIVLAVALSGLLPDVVASAALVVALALLAESFGRDVWWLRRRRADPATPYPTGGGPTLVAIGVVWAALLLPTGPAGLVRLPAEALLLAGVALLPRGRRFAATAVGVLIAALVVVHAMDRGFETFLDRPFDPLTDWRYLGPGVDVLGDSIGDSAAWATAAAAAVLVLALLVALPLATVRVAGVLARHRQPTLALGVACLLAPLLPIGSTASSGLAYAEVRQVRADLADQRAFAARVDDDPWEDPPALRGLRGRDVLVVFVESYGRVALDMPQTTAAVAAGSRRLDDADWRTRSAYLTSPTFGAASWLAHATLQSGLWVDSQRRYDQLIDADRTTLTSAFDDAGWRTVFDVPANTRDWPEGQAFYGFDDLYDSRNVGYRGPDFGYAPVPDQYTLATFTARELTPTDRPPTFAEIDLVSSHHPWTPQPPLTPWDEVGDGAGLHPPQETLDDVRAKYDRNIAYSLTTLVSWLETQPDDDLVLLVLGDHQPHSYVTGPDPGHDVPATVIARDPRVLHRIDGWGWRPGLRPSDDGPVWPMDDLRDRLFAAFEE
ncbi:MULTISPECIES: CDP-alcohol phosphatidyltransferase family protein [unclassified Nocardioides]|uniref:CDP-alcohol phosphatidyltransferase family protein n=1 Tax=unclassified Nocardioides TaxID=2615069 RepID=UPI003609F4BA